MARPTRPPLITTAFIALAAADLAYFTADGVAIFALPLYVVGPIDGNEFAAGVAFGAFAVSALVLRPIAGRLADQFGRRPMMIGGALLAAGSLALTAVADSLPIVIALRTNDTRTPMPGATRPLPCDAAALDALDGKSAPSSPRTS